MAAMGEKKKLTHLDTKGVAIVTAGANGKRIALAKGAETIEEAFLRVIKAGEMPLDDKAIEDLCMAAGLDPQAVETFKAIMKLAHVYGDNAAFNGLLKQQFTTAQAPAGAPVPGQQPHAQPGAMGQPGATPPGAHAPSGYHPPQPGGNAGQPGAAPPAGPPPNEPHEKPGDEKQHAAGKEPGEGSPAEEQNDAPPSGDKKEPPMDLEKEKQLKKAADEAVEKAAAAEAQIVDLKKSNDVLKASLDAQKVAVEASTQAVQKMQDDLALAQWVSKAKEDLSFVPGKTPDELGKMLFDLAKLNPEMAKGQFELLKSQAAIVKSSGLFAPAGTTGSAPAAAGSAWAEAQQRAGDIVKKGLRDGETQETAMARATHEVFKADRALYKRYCAEQKETNVRAFN